MHETRETRIPDGPGCPVDGASLEEGESVDLRKGDHIFRHGVVSRVLAQGAFILFTSETDGTRLFLHSGDGFAICRPSANKAQHERRHQ